MEALVASGSELKGKQGANAERGKSSKSSSYRRGCRRQALRCVQTRLTPASRGEADYEQRRPKKSWSMTGWNHGLWIETRRGDHGRCCPHRADKLDLKSPALYRSRESLWEYYQLYLNKDKGGLAPEVLEAWER